MIIGVVRERLPGETRVAATPANVEQLLALGYRVIVERGAGVAATFSDEAYGAAGADLGGTDEVLARADVVLGINPPSAEQLAGLIAGATLISLLSPGASPELVEALSAASLGVPINALAMDAVPRISRAQAFDVLSSMANLAGYRAVVEATYEFGRLFTGQVTAAGKVPPAKVLVVGAGVAGLAAVAVAGSLGAIVRATDPRPEVAEQVGSLGGEYLAVLPSGESAEGEASTTGYAREMGEDYKTLEARLYAAQVQDVDIVITTALIPGRPAPAIITAEMVASMKPGSVIVDMAAQNGGNVAGTVAGQKVVTDGGVTILGYTDLPGRLPAQSSQLYGSNLVNLLRLMTPGLDGNLVIDLDDVVVRSMTVVSDGAPIWPPPPVGISAAPPPQPAVGPDGPSPATHRPKAARRVGVVGAAGAAAVLGAAAPASLLPHLTVFALAIVIGYYVIGHVHHALHTPLMSVTNAISGIIVVGAMVTMVHDETAVLVLACVATLVASINVIGGFAVTRRMLAMFSRSHEEAGLS